MSENLKRPSDHKDRLLGDEWTDWNGANEGPVIEGTFLFLIFSFGIFLLTDVILGFLYYLVVPRLFQITDWLPNFTLFILILWIALTFFFWLQLTLTVLSGKNLFFAKGQIFFIFDLVFTNVFRLARMFRISRDQIGHSFIKVSNAVVRAVDSNVINNKKLLILLPRCLTKDQLQEINKLKEKYPVEVFTVSGGELARKKVKETCPSAIIGVACERDLVSGIRDVAHKIPVIGIPNRRPNGPCKDTSVDIDELTKTVEAYFNKQSGEGENEKI